jgi:protein O-mannosyl-transferase
LCSALIAYWPALGGSALWDDDAHLTKPALQSWHGLYRIWFELGATQQYYPLTHSAFWLERRLWGDAFAGYHLANIFLHSLAAFLLVCIMRRLALPGAWLAGFLFVLHPVCVEAVAWISEQKSTLSTVFYLAAMLVYLRFDRTRRGSAYFLALALFVLAILSKTVTATLPAALLVVFWWRRGRIDIKRDLAPLIPWLLLGVAAGTLTAWIERDYIGAKGEQFTLTPVDRFLVAGRVIWFYLLKIVWPADLMFSYPHWTVDSTVWWQYLFPLGVAFLVAALWIVARRGSRGPLAALLLFIGTLVPVLGFLNVYPFVFSYVADHFQYLAMLAIVVPAAAVFSRMADRSAKTRLTAQIGLGALLLTLGVLTSIQASNYTNSETLYRSVIAKNPSSMLAQYNLGMTLSKDPAKIEEAVVHLRTALRINPKSAPAHYDLGNILAKVPGETDAAIAEYETSLSLDPNLALAHSDLGLLLAGIPGRAPEAVAHLEEALRLQPDLREAHNNLGIALMRVPGRLADAESHLETALTMDPNWAEAHSNLAAVLTQIPGRQQDAVKQYEAALAINPSYAEAHYGLGFLLSSDPSRVDQAIGHYEEALRIRPDYAEAHFGLGTILINTPGRLPDGIDQLEAAVRTDPDFAVAHYNLAFALMKSPRRDRVAEAVAHLEKAIAINPGLRTPRILEAIRGFHAHN